LIGKPKKCLLKGRKSPPPVHRRPGEAPADDGGVGVLRPGKGRQGHPVYGRLKPPGRSSGWWFYGCRWNAQPHAPLKQGYSPVPFGAKSSSPKGAHERMFILT